MSHDNKIVQFRLQFW